MTKVNIGGLIAAREFAIREAHALAKEVLASLETEGGK